MPANITLPQAFSDHLHRNCISARGEKGWWKHENIVYVCEHYLSNKTSISGIIFVSVTTNVHLHIRSMYVSRYIHAHKKKKNNKASVRCNLLVDALVLTPPINGHHLINVSSELLNEFTICNDSSTLYMLIIFEWKTLECAKWDFNFY